MSMKKFDSVQLFIGLLLAVVVAVFVSQAFLFMSSSEEPLIGGERDEHGCLGPAGYTWDENVNACLRSWELNENQKEAARIAVEHVGYEKGLTIIEVAVARCIGCFVVEIEKGKDRIEVTLYNWEVTETSLTPEQCEALGGRPLNTVGGDTCDWNETNVGDVTGFISPNICCVPGEADPSSLCNAESDVYVCEEYVKVVSYIPGAGATYSKEGIEVVCPLVAPDSVSDECKALEELVCGSNLCS